MIGQFSGRPPVTVDHDDLRHTLVVSAFEKGDPLWNAMHAALGHLEEVRLSHFSIEFRRVLTAEEFVDVVNRSNMPIMVFDGHGVRNDGCGHGGLSMGGEVVDVWGLRTRVLSHLRHRASLAVRRIRSDDAKPSGAGRRDPRTVFRTVRKP